MVVQYLTKYYSLYNNLNYANSHIFISSHPYDKRVSKDNSLMMSSLPKPCPLNTSQKIILHFAVPLLGINQKETSKYGKNNIEAFPCIFISTLLSTVTLTFTTEQPQAKWITIFT